MIGVLTSLFSVAMTLAVASNLPADCTGCSFAGRDLRGADLSGGNYVGVDFARTDLRDANLRNARLIGVDLESALLEGARFDAASVVGGDLRDASLRKAKLCWRNDDGRVGCDDLRGADVRGADFRGALICRGREPKGCSTVDAQTLRARSGSNLAGAML